ncbi:GNAT family N-acetyltransferase [Corynebacterium sp. HS2168-gen11]|uniref:GNAT family N-acetyltransferase n=1 Tax=Corynebacterium sp. HS2168-gen11 TaxID=2974027 RepID=UPI00216AEA11|nr:GNAT family N-acetyltransferase [Corynebacterium sp. HS2168-gen11]MCS4536354.1 GNAT family N-acetyltransferase [Corynebacterium sp. HS2168-gen11]
MTVFFQFETPAASITDFIPSDALRSFVFSANLASQDITGDTADSTTTAAVFEVLKGSSAASNIVLAAANAKFEDFQNFKRSSLGYPIIAAHEDSQFPKLPDVDIYGYLDITISHDSDTNGIDADALFHAEFAPLPGENLNKAEAKIYRMLLNELNNVVKHAHRDVIRLWQRTTTPRSAELDTYARQIAAAGYTFSMEELHGMVRLSKFADLQLPVLPDGFTVQSFTGLVPPKAWVPEMIDLLDQLSFDVPTGALAVDPQPWSLQRLVDADNIAQLRRNETFTVALLHNDRLIGYSGASRRHDALENIAEQGATIIERAYRGRGLGQLLKNYAVKEIQQHWPTVEKLYTSMSSENNAILAINDTLGFQTQSYIHAWQKHR